MYLAALIITPALQHSIHWAHNYNSNCVAKPLDKYDKEQRLRDSLTINRQLVRQLKGKNGLPGIIAGFLSNV